MAAWGTDSWFPSYRRTFRAPRNSARRRGSRSYLPGLFGTGILFGLAPALADVAAGFRGALNESARGTAANRPSPFPQHPGHWSKSRLPCYFSLVPDCFCKAFRLSRVNPGVQPERSASQPHRITRRLLSEAGKDALFQNHSSRLRGPCRALIRASTVMPMPLSGSNMSTSFDIEERPEPKGQGLTSPFRLAGDDYFQTSWVSSTAGSAF